jgi:hypothetical protein
LPFLQLILDDSEEIRENTFYLLSQIEKTAYPYLLPHMDLLMEAIEHEVTPKNFDILYQLVSQLLELLSFNALLSHIEKIIDFYKQSDNPIRNEILLHLLEHYVPDLEKRVKERWSKRIIIKKLENRPFLVKVFDLNKISIQENLSIEQVEDYLLSELENNDTFYVQYKEKGNQKILIMEKSRLISLLSSGKIELSHLYELIENAGIQTSGIVPVVIREMLEKRLIQGYTDTKSFYSWKYLKDEAKRTLRQQGFIQLKNFIQNLDKKIVRDVIDEITRDPIYNGIYNIKGTKFHTFKSMTKQIENMSARSNIIDLSSYKDDYGQDNQLRLEKYCQTHFFTNNHIGHKWLTNLGLIRIQQMMQTSQQIGYCDLDEQSNELEIPSQILFTVVRNIFDRRNGFWNKSQNKFFYGNFVKKQISIIQNEPDTEKRDLMIQELADELEIAPAEISQKVEEKLKTITVSLKLKDEFKIKPLMKDLQMDYKEFLHFIDSFNKDYIVLDEKIIFKENMIKEAKQQLKAKIEIDANHQSIIDLKKFAIRSKCSPKLLQNLMESLLKEEKISGLWIEPNIKYLTKYGIQQRMIEAKGFLDLQTSIEEIDATEEQILFLEKIMKDLIAKQELDGIYDEETQIYQSKDVAGEASLNTERERFTKEITPHIEDLEFGYIMCQEILMRPDTTPQDIQEYQEILDEQKKKILYAEAFIRKWINNADQRLSLDYKQQKKGTNLLMMKSFLSY